MIVRLHSRNLARLRRLAFDGEGSQREGGGMCRDRGRIRRWGRLRRSKGSREETIKRLKSGVVGGGLNYSHGKQRDELLRTWIDARIWTASGRSRKAGEDTACSTSWRCFGKSDCFMVMHYAGEEIKSAL